MEKLNKVLIIDDDEINNFVCSKVIHKNDFSEEVKTVLSGHEALTYLKSLLSDENSVMPDLILLDINMPVMNGWAFLEEYQTLLQDFKKQPILMMLSSSVYEEDVEKAKQHPEVKDYITKPLSKSILDQIYENFFGNPKAKS